MRNLPTFQRRSTQLVVNKLMLVIAIGAALIGLWLVLESLTYEAREQVLLCLIGGLGIAPIVLLVLPRTLTWIYWPVTAWTAAVGLRYCGDMGADGHMITAAFVVMAAFWAGLVGWLLCQRHSRNGNTGPRPSPRAQWGSMSTLVPLFVMLFAVVFFSIQALAAIQQHREHQRLAAPFEAAGMRVYFDAAGGISVQCNSWRFGDPQLLAVIGHLQALNDLKILNLSFTGITDASLRELGKLRSLEYLSLYQTGVTDAGLTHLIGMRGLEDLDLRETHVTNTGLAQLLEALPDCLIEH